MDPTVEYLWAAGYDLPPEPSPEIVAKPDLPRRGKKAARAKRQKAVS
jgi:hypothetical protein